MALFCPVTSQIKGYPFEVAIPPHLPVAGVILADQIKRLDWKSRKASFCCKLPPVALKEATAKLAPLIN